MFRPARTPNTCLHVYLVTTLLGCNGASPTHSSDAAESGDDATEFDEIDVDSQANTRSLDLGGDLAPTLELSLSQVKQFDFSWEPVAGAEYYQLLESTDIGAPYVQVGADVVEMEASLTVPVHFRLNASYKLRACSDGEGCIESAPVDTVGALVEAIGYFKPSSTKAYDYFGWKVVLSDDGNTLVVSARGKDGVGVAENGAVYVFVRTGQNTWSQQAYLTASNPGANDSFGYSVALSADGNTLAVGAWYEDSNATGIGGDQANNSAVDAGAVYVFVRDGQNGWSQQAYVKASNTGAGDLFGRSVALSDDGNTLAVGAYLEDGIDDSPNNDGAAYVFVRDGQNMWSQQAYVKDGNGRPTDHFGWEVALSGDGNTLAVSAFYDDNGDLIGANRGAVWVFARNGQNVWSQPTHLGASNPVVPCNGYLHGNRSFGDEIALSEDGNTLAVGSPWEASSATGIGGDQNNCLANNSGAVYVFVRYGYNAWSQEAYIKASNTGQADYFGSGLALSGDGNVLAVGADRDDSNATGIGGNQADVSTDGAGAVYMFTRNEQHGWSQAAYVKASNSGQADNFGQSVALSEDGHTLTIGAYREDSNAVGIGGSQASNSVVDAGAVYVY